MMWNLLLNSCYNVLLTLLIDVSLYFYLVPHCLIPGFILTFKHLSLLVLHLLFLVPVYEGGFLPLTFEFNCVLFFKVKYLVFFRVSEDTVLFEFLLNHFLNHSIMRELLLES
jgi:hypothetical protein